MNFQKLLQKLSDDFLSAWNASDKKKLMSFFKSNTQFISPNVSILYPDKINNTIVGTKEINLYFSVLYNDVFPILKRENLIKKGRTLITYCSVEGTTIKLIVDIKLNEYGKIIFIETKYVNEYPI